MYSEEECRDFGQQKVAEDLGINGARKGKSIIT